MLANFKDSCEALIQMSQEIEYFPGYQPEAEPEKITDEQLESFMENVIWPAADASYGTNFRAVAVAGEDTGEELSEPFYSPDHEQAVFIDFMAYCESYGQDVVSHEAVLYFYTLRTDFDEDLSEKSLKKGAIWEVLEYEFDPDDHDFTVYKYFDFLTLKAEPVERTPHDVKMLTETLRKTNSRITRQACLDVYNALVTVGIPETEMHYDDWVEMAASGTSDKT
jgi:hypothetical protein